MNKRKVKLTIICEDTQQECFARRFLYGMGWDYRKLRIEKSPSGRCSGEQWVREKYVEELKNYRRSNTDYAILAIVDGDTLGVQGRIQQFNNKCSKLDVQHRKPGERVAIVVPTHSIETWIRYLKGNPVNEQCSYPKLRYESECKPFVDNLVRICNSTGLPVNAPDSLHKACDEFRSRIQ